MRGLCAIGLVALGYKDVLFELVDLLFDEAAEARLLAARALGGTGADAAALLLRAKLAAGNDTAEIFGECFAGLLSLQPQRSIDLIARYLVHADSSLSQAAALTIGASRHPRAFQLLVEARESDPLKRTDETLLTSIALTRDPEALELLLDELSSQSIDVAVRVVAALKIFKSDPAAAARVERLLAERNHAKLHRAWR